MITTVYMSIDGDRQPLEELAADLGVKHTIVKYPACHTLRVSLRMDSSEYQKAESCFW